MIQRVVVFTGKPNYTVLKGIVEVDRLLPGVEWLVLVSKPRRDVRRLAINHWRHLKRNGWRWILYQLQDATRRITASSGGNRNTSAPGAEYDTETLRRCPRVQWITAEDIHADEVLQRVRNFAPDLGLSLAAPILRRQLFSLPALGTLNLHKGELPSFRGMPPAFWELWSGVERVGCSVHWVEDGLDTGDIAARDEIAIDRFATLRGVQLQLDEVGVRLVNGAVLDVANKRARRQPQLPGGNTYRQPTLIQQEELGHRMVKRQPAKETSMRSLGKAAIHASLVQLQRFGISAALSPRVTVLLYHRVTDEVRDNLTVGIEQFDRQMQLLRSHCRVLSIEDVLSLRGVPRSRRPLVAVTFDDGYLDNYANAYPILQRHRIPAAFFVSTAIVSSSGRFPHDKERNNPHIPVMSWEQLREMRQRGFTIGSHTANHIDCAARDPKTVREELVQSRDTLRRELAIDSVYFAYPYGGRQHMTPDKLEIVKEVGYGACLSAYGASNKRQIDPFNVMRQSINWEFSDDAFLSKCLGL